MIPFGYRLNDGRAVVDPTESEMLLHFYRIYLEGAGIADAAAQAGMSYSVARTALSNETYLGNDFYPPLVTQAYFERLRQERQHRNRGTSARGRDRVSSISVQERFTIDPMVFTDEPVRPSELIAWLYAHIIEDDTTKHRRRRMNPRIRDAVLDYARSCYHESESHTGIQQEERPEDRGTSE